MTEVTTTGSSQLCTLTGNEYCYLPMDDAGLITNGNAEITSNDAKAGTLPKICLLFEVTENGVAFIFFYLCIDWIWNAGF